MEFSYTTTMCWIRRKNAGDQMSQLACCTVKAQSCACLFQSLDVAYIVHHQKDATHSALYDNDQLISLALYSLNTILKLYSIFVVCRRLISRFRCGCHGLHVDTGCFHSQSLIGCADLHLVRLSITFCLTAQRILKSETHGRPQTVACLINSNNSTVVEKYLGTCFSHKFVLEHDSISV